MKNKAFLTFILPLFFGCSTPQQQAEGTGEPEKYNILFLAADDLNDYVQSLGGHPDAITPELDKFVAQSYVFENAYCPAQKMKGLPGLRASINRGFSLYATHTT